tara:strand:- start:203 stop:583 length:381 start_codon:yes stop_codon:yes gene_type:complete
MKITRRRLEEIIKEELTKYEWDALKLDDADGPFVLRMSGKGAEESHFHGLDSSGRPKFGGRHGAHVYDSIDKAMDRQGALKDDGAGLAEVEPVQAVKVSTPTDKKVDRLRRGFKTGRWRDLEEGEK